MYTIIDDPERWWREKGQFLPPCDKIHDAASLEIFKQFTISIAKTIEDEEELFLESEDNYEKGFDDGFNAGFDEGAKQDANSTN